MNEQIEIKVLKTFIPPLLSHVRSVWQIVDQLITTELIDWHKFSYTS